MSDTSSASGGGPRLELPSRESWGLPAQPSRGGGVASWVFSVLLAAVLGLQIWGLVLLRDAPGGTADVPRTAERAAPIPAARLRELSAHLQRNNLPGAAAEVHEEYLESLPADSKDERVKALVTLARLLVQARRYEEAVVRLYQAEVLGPDAETQRFIDEQVRLCLQKLGRHDELAYELADRTSASRGKESGQSPGAAAADREVARIGIEPITSARLDAMIGEEVDRQIDSIPGLAAEDRERYRERMLQELRDPKRRLQKLHELVTREVLFREGIQRELDRSPAVQRELDAVRESLIARQVVFDAMESRIHLSEVDLRSFFAASQARYVEPASASVRIALLPTEEAAREALGAVTSEADFERIASERSLEETTKANGGLLSAPVVEGAPFPVLGNEPELTKAVLATTAGKATSAPVKTARGFAIAFVREKTPRRTPTFDEARSRVAQDYMRQKEAEVQQELIAELFRKHAVTVRTEAFLNPGDPASEGSEATPDAGDAAAGGSPAEDADR